MNNQLMYDAITVFGRGIVYEVMELAECCDLKVAYDTYKSVGMDDYAECVEYLFFNN